MMSTQQPPFGQYQLIEKIAQGGMAEIFRGKALDAHGIEKPVVIKRILPHIASSPEFVEMLIDEAKIAVMLSHGNIAQVYDLGKIADDYFIVMEYVDGKTLSQIMKRLKNTGQQMPIACVVSIVAEIASGLDYMHRKVDDRGNPLKIVHRDISPQNIILSTAGTVKIIDFGIAKAKNKISTTDSGVLKGKFAYMSPEHAEGEKLDHRSDIFSLGVILFELLTGERLFKDKTNIETINRVKKAKVPLPSSIRSSIPKDLDKIVLHTLLKDRDKRYQSAQELASQLIKFLFTHYPNFSPRDLVTFLQQVFPELIPEEPTGNEETELGTLVEKADKKEAITEVRSPQIAEETQEETFIADSEIIRTKLKESEVFLVPDHPQETKAPSPQPSFVAPMPPIEEHELTSEMRPEKEPTPILPTLPRKDAWTRTFKPFFQRILPSGKRPLVLLSGIVIFGLVGGTTYSLVRYLSVPHSNSSKGTQEMPVENPTSEPPSETPPTSPKDSNPGGFGSIHLESDPPGAQIFVNQEETNKKTPTVLEKIPAGGQKIRLTLDHYREWEGRLDVEAGKTNYFSVILEPNYGSLSIDSSPQGAKVILNDHEEGTTPFEKNDIPPNTTYQVLLTLNGFESWTGQVKVAEGKAESVTATLKKK